MLHNLFEVTPFRLVIGNVLSVHAWANLEMMFAVFVMLLSFAQKQFDHSFSNKGLLGFFGYISLVFKATYAFAVLWDGIYVSIHPMTEGPRPIATMAMFIIATQQSVHLLTRATTHRIVVSRATSLLPNELPHRVMPSDTGIPAWVLFLIDTSEWAHAYTRNVFRHRRR